MAAYIFQEFWVARYQATYEDQPMGARVILFKTFQENPFHITFSCTTYFYVFGLPLLKTNYSYRNKYIILIKEFKLLSHVKKIM